MLRVDHPHQAPSKPSYALWAILGVCCACGGPTEQPLQLDVLRQPVVNGDASDASDDATVYIAWEGGESCSATLVAPNLLVTALHCVTVSPELTNFACRPDGTLEPGPFGEGSLGGLTQASRVQVQVGPVFDAEPEAFGVRLLGTGSSQICRNDIAFMILDRELDAPISSVRLERETLSGERVRVLGYGGTEAGVNRDNLRHIREGMRILAVGPDAETATTTSAAPRTLVVGEGPCQGDSGGPVFAEETGALLGAYSLAAGASCTAVGIRNVYTKLQPFSQLLLQAFDEAGHEPLLEEVDQTPTEQPSGIVNQGCGMTRGAARGAAALWALGWWAVTLTWLARRRATRHSTLLRS